MVSRAGTHPTRRAWSPSSIRRPARRSRARVRSRTLLRHRCGNARSELVSPGGFYRRRRLGERPSAAAQAHRRRLSRPCDRAAERQGLYHRRHQPLSGHGRRCAPHRYGQTSRTGQPARIRERLEGAQARSVRLRGEFRQGVRLGRHGRWRQRPLADPPLVVHPPRQRSAQSQRGRRLRICRSRLRFVLLVSRQSSRGHYQGLAQAMSMDWIMAIRRR